MATLRPAQPADTPGVLKLIAEIFREYGCTLDAEHEDTHLLAPGPHFRQHHGEFWVLDCDGEIKATLGVVLLPESAELKCLYVHQSIRRQGWATRLSDHAIEFARRAGRRRITLWSDTRFVAAHRLYESLGFRRRGERELHDSNQTREYGFYKQLETNRDPG